MQRRASTASSLLFNAAYLCRLQFPLVWLYLMSLDWPLSEDEKAARFEMSAFQKVVEMDSASVLGPSGLNVIASLLVIIYAVVSYYRPGRRYTDFRDAADLEEKVTAGIAILQRSLADHGSNQHQLGD